MKYESNSGKFAAICAALALAIPVQAQVREAEEPLPSESVEPAESHITEDSAEIPENPEISDDEGLADDQGPEPAIQEPAVQDQAELDQPELDRAELVAVDDLPDEDQAATEMDEFNEEEDALVPEPTDKESNLDELRRNFALYKTAIENASYDEADTLAKRMVELTIRLYGLDSHESSKALTNLGRVQQKNQDYESAVLNFTAAIEIIERIEDRLNSELINPLRGLGAAQLGAGRPDMARKSYDRAVHVSHVNEGPHNLMQIRVLEELAETYLTLGDQDKALDIHQFIYNLEARNIDRNTEDMIPALERQAEWTHRMRMHERERVTWRKIINILEDSRGKKDLSLIRPLTGLANSYLFVSDMALENYDGPAISSGDAYLKRAIRISAENPESTWDLQARTLLALGDYYTLTDRASKAMRIYRDTWTLLSGDEEREQHRAATLESSKLLQNIHPPKYYNVKSSDTGGGKPEDFESGKIIVAYNVSSRGNATDMRIIEADPPGFEELEYAVAREMRRLIHRPQMTDGDFVEAVGKTYTHDYFYRLSDLPQVEEEQVDESVAVEES